MSRAFVCENCKEHILYAADQFDIQVHFISKDRKTRLRAVSVGETCRNCVQGQANRVTLLKDQQTLKAYDLVAQQFGHPEILSFEEVV